MVLVAIGYRSPAPSNTVTANAAAVSDSSNSAVAAQPSVDDVVATSVAADVAQSTNLPIAANVANLSTSTQINSQLTQSSDATVVSKPQIVQPTASGTAITTYTSVPGDTVESIAAKYNVSTDTVKWANNLSSDAINPGTTLQILPVNGILYTVKDGDTVQNLASKYKADATRITVFNDLETTTSLTAGSKIIIPDGVLPTDERPGYVAPQQVYSITSSYAGYYNFQSGSVGNRYAFGNCTWYAYNRRAELGEPVGSFWGNASTWAIAARGSGYLVDDNPTPGAVQQSGGGYDGFGHVAVVESTVPGVSVTISEMNAYRAGGGFDRVDYFTMSWAEAVGGNYNYIH